MIYELGIHNEWGIRNRGAPKHFFAQANNMLLSVRARRWDLELQKLPFAKVRKAKCGYTRDLLSGNVRNLA